MIANISPLLRLELSQDISDGVVTNFDDLKKLAAEAVALLFDENIFQVKHQIIVHLDFERKRAYVDLRNPLKPAQPGRFTS